MHFSFSFFLLHFFVLCKKKMKKEKQKRNVTTIEWHSSLQSSLALVSDSFNHCAIKWNEKANIEFCTLTPFDNANFPKIINEYRDLVQLNHETWQQQQQHPKFEHKQQSIQKHQKLMHLNILTWCKCIHFEPDTATDGKEESEEQTNRMFCINWSALVANWMNIRNGVCTPHKLSSNIAVFVHRTLSTTNRFEITVQNIC